MINGLRHLAGTLMALVISGCAAAPDAGLTADAALPHDFELDLTIVAGPPIDAPRGADESQLAKHPHLRPSKYVLAPDGTLRYGLDPDRTRGTYWLPPLTRTLSQAQVLEIWTTAQQLGLTDPQAGDPVVNFRLIKPRAGELLYMLQIKASDQRCNFVRVASETDSSDDAVVALINSLAVLAWTEQSLPSQGTVLPKRYDFGPDPYARYRNR